MILRSIAVLVVAAVLVAIPLTWRDNAEPTVQGWVEADLVFVSPDESGRIETLGAREGDHVTVGQQLFTLDDELQRADLAQAQATMINVITCSCVAPGAGEVGSTAAVASALHPLRPCGASILLRAGAGSPIISRC